MFHCYKNVRKKSVKQLLGKQYEQIRKVAPYFKIKNFQYKYKTNLLKMRWKNGPNLYFHRK